MTCRRIAPLLCLAMAACGSADPPAGRDDADEAPQEAVFDDLVEQHDAIPARIEDAQRQRVDETRRALDAAEGGVREDEPGR